MNNSRLETFKAHFVNLTKHLVTNKQYPKYSGDVKNGLVYFKFRNQIL